MNESGESPPKETPNGKRSGPGNCSAASTQVSALRTWIQRGACVVIAPVLFLLLVEGALRLAGYGDDLGFLVATQSTDVLTANPSFSSRFFPAELAQRPYPFRLPVDKDSKEFRVFVLGGSAALGTPEPAFGFWRILGQMVREAYPSQNVRIVNTAMAAINSHVVRCIAEECAQYEPDLFIVYMGNNEVIGPYGPGTVFGGFIHSIHLIHASIALRGTRTGQLISRLVSRLGSLARTDEKPAQVTMALFAGNKVAAADPRMEDVYAHFRQNLEAICDAALNAGAEVLLCTVATNLRDCAPFASVHRKALGAEELLLWQEQYSEAVRLEDDLNWAAAAEAYLAAAAVDDQWGELHFRLARCKLALGRPEQARQHYARALDMDALRFRADSHINSIIRQVAAERAGSGVHLVDAEAVFRAHPMTPHGLPGHELFWEHVHMNYTGNYALAKAVFERLSARLAPYVERPPPDPQQCAELLVLTEPVRYRIIRSVLDYINNPPFTGQLNHQEQVSRLQEQLIQLEPHMRRQELLATEKALEEALERQPQDFFLRYRLQLLREFLAQGRRP